MGKSWRNETGLVFLLLCLPLTAACGGGDGGPASVNAQNTTTEQQILDKLNVLESKIDGLNFPGVTQNWDKNLPSSSRFTVLANFGGAAVRDNNTGLVWEQAADSTTRTWADATLYCLNKAVGGTTGWRVPSVVELNSVRDPSLVAGFVPDIFSGVQGNRFWSATTVASNTSNAWNVDFSGGFVTSFAKGTSSWVWCVRGPMNSDSY